MIANDNAPHDESRAGRLVREWREGRRPRPTIEEYEACAKADHRELQKILPGLPDYDYVVALGKQLAARDGPSNIPEKT